MNIDPTAFAPTRRRANRIQNNIEDVLTESRKSFQEQKQDMFLNKEMERDLSFEDSRKYLRESSSIEVNKDIINENDIADFIFGEAFANIVYNSIPLDEEYKETLKTYIIENASETFNNLNASNSLLEGTYAWKRYFNNFTSVIPTLKENYNNAEKVQEILKTLEEQVSEFEKPLFEIVESKVLETISNEQYIASNREKLIKENKNFTGSTLFNSLNVKNMRLIESNELNKDMTDEEKLNKAFTESIIDYTILETFNTFGLLDFNTDNISELTRRLLKN